jgi:hypothetical protein
MIIEKTLDPSWGDENYLNIDLKFFQVSFRCARGVKPFSHRAQPFFILTKKTKAGFFFNQ